MPSKSAPKFGAKTRAGKECSAPALPNGRCHVHGGLSTGARTEAGRLRIVIAQHRRWSRYYRSISEGLTA